jgi:glycosyltransferase involved in cell wall biosynthesis
MATPDDETPAATGRGEPAGESQVLTEAATPLEAMAPKFSVVIATYQRPLVLAQTLDRLTPERQQVSQGLFEIIVTDDSRDDATEHMVRREYPHVRYVRGSRRGPATNRNCGAAVARGQWIAFIDDDCQPVEGWLAALERVDATSRPDVIEGAILAPDKVDSPFRHYGENLTGDLYWSGNLAVRRDVFNRLGRFDEDFPEAAGDDLEFGDRIRRSGVPAVFSAAAAVVHPTHPVSWRYIFWHAFTIRWHLLYALKRGQAPPADSPTWHVLSSLVANRTLNLLRVTWRALRRPDPARRRTDLFNVAMSWMMFPIILPYMIYWDLRFRRMLRARGRPVLTPTGGPVNR